MKLNRWLTIFAGVTVVGVLGVTVHRNPTEGFIPELVTPMLVLALTAVLGLLTYEPRRVFGAFKGIYTRKFQGDQSFNRRILAQMAIYALIAGIALAIMQVLTTSDVPPDLGKMNMALWFLLYGVLIAVVIWAVSGVDRLESAENGQGARSYDGNQVVLVFCVLLLTVGVLSVLCLEIFHVGEKNVESHLAPMTADWDTGMRLGDDYKYRLASFEEKNNQGSPSGAVGAVLSSDRQDRQSSLAAAPARKVASDVPLR